MYIDTEGILGQERFRQLAEGKDAFAEAGPHSIRFSHPPIFHVLCSGEPLNTCQMAMENIVYAGCYTSGHFARLLLGAASLIVNDKHRYSFIPLRRDLCKPRD